MPEFIMLRLEGALQSWGENSKWKIRDTSLFPSKSAITGLIACAMGLKRGDKHIRELSANIRLGIRADRMGTLLCDYHTIQGMPDLNTANGKTWNSNTMVSNRYYLNDASFLVVIETDDEWKNTIVNALKHPKWTLYLGRKSCVPSRPILEAVKIYDSILEALENHPYAQRMDPDEYVQIEIDQYVPDSGEYSRTDNVTGLRSFSKRNVWRRVIRRSGNVSD